MTGYGGTLYFTYIPIGWEKCSTASPPRYEYVTMLHIDYHASSLWIENLHL